MGPPVIQARIAPVALLIALAFVIVGFFRADRDMTRAERDRAELTVSETATLVEAFVLRRLTELQTAAEIIEAGASSSSGGSDDLSAVVTYQPALHLRFTLGGPWPEAGVRVVALGQVDQDRGAVGERDVAVLEHRYLPERVLTQEPRLLLRARHQIHVHELVRQTEQRQVQLDAMAMTRDWMTKNSQRHARHPATFLTE